MKGKVQKWLFEKRIFVSFAIVALVCALAFGRFKSHFMLGGILFKWLGFAADFSQTMAFVLAACFMLLASLLRMWAGTILTPRTMMRFAVQNEHLMTIGPYRLVRNPIYGADLIAFVGFALVLPAVGLLMPALLLLHYQVIIHYEEKALFQKHGQQFADYCKRVNRLFPGIKGFKQWPVVVKEWAWSPEGALHNALYLLFVPGFLVSAVRDQIWPALIFGLPGVLFWTVLHLQLGKAEHENWFKFGKRPGPSRS